MCATICPVEPISTDGWIVLLMCRGSFAVVKVGTPKDGSCNVAIKIIQKSPFDVFPNRLAEEVEIMKRVLAISSSSLFLCFPDLAYTRARRPCCTPPTSAAPDHVCNSATQLWLQCARPAQDPHVQPLVACSLNPTLSPPLSRRGCRLIIQTA